MFCWYCLEDAKSEDKYCLSGCGKELHRKLSVQLDTTEETRVYRVGHSVPLKFRIINDSEKDFFDIQFIAKFGFPHDSKKDEETIPKLRSH